MLAEQALQHALSNLVKRTPVQPPARMLKYLPSMTGPEDVLPGYSNCLAGTQLLIVACSDKIP